MTPVTLRIIKVLSEVTEGEYEDLFPPDITNDEKLQLLTSESMLALVFVTSLEDEFEIEFQDDEVDVSFFSSIEALTAKVRKYVQAA
ncbi:MAG: hypothetical protein WC615_01295 [Mucilaginibacter sp.]|jgi:acyl carrier protein|uniref:hypothetical protein n=1 Tax=Mucilaginibacter sp. TaxID=1882438 RepID=UPI00356A65FE